MTIKERVDAFVKLGDLIRRLTEDEREKLRTQARAENNWFTPEAVDTALYGIEMNLYPDKLEEWINKYPVKEKNKTIAVVMAGNVPAVGFHDLLCILLSGNNAMVRLSSKDAPLLTFLIRSLVKVAPAIERKLQITDQLKDMDAVIATGSDNSSRYFDYYFGKYPHIIRKNRTSVGVLTGEETEDDIRQLGRDIFLYYGLGCRNVSKLFAPHEYNFSFLLNALEPFSTVMQHHKYHNNYDYNKSIYLVNKEHHLDNGFLLLKEDPQIVSPISVLFYESYRNGQDLTAKLNEQENKIQCIVSKSGHWPGSAAYGKAQFPELDDYADGVDTMEFLTRL